MKQVTLIAMSLSVLLSLWGLGHAATLASITYTPSSVKSPRGSPIPTMTPSDFGWNPPGTTSYSISPLLPQGLQLDAGVIYGTPSVTAAKQLYTITETTPVGTTGGSVTIWVVDTPPSDVQYVPSPVTYTVGLPIDPPAKPQHQGGVITKSEIVPPAPGEPSPELPPGLILGPDGEISGTPTAPFEATTYTVQVSNSGGSALGTITIGADKLGYSANPVVYPSGVDIGSNAPSTSTGTGTSYQLLCLDASSDCAHPTASCAPPPGLKFKAGVLTGTPTALNGVTSSWYAYCVTATQGSSTVSTRLDVRVNDLAVQHDPANGDHLVYQGNQGNPFVVKGVNLGGFSMPKGCGTGLVRSARQYIEKSVGDGGVEDGGDGGVEDIPGELAAFLTPAQQAWGANTVRFMFSQNGLDPTYCKDPATCTDPTYNANCTHMEPAKADAGACTSLTLPNTYTYYAATQSCCAPVGDAGVSSGCALYGEGGAASVHTGYVNDVVTAVNTARNLGFVVIATVSHEGDPEVFGLPTASTQQALSTLASKFGNDSGVMIDIFNEPGFNPLGKGNGLLTTCKGSSCTYDWSSWQNGCTCPPDSPDAGSSACSAPVCDTPGATTVVGMQTLVDDLRSEGASNVLMIEGVVGPQTLDGLLDAGANVSDPIDYIGQYGYATHPYLDQDSNDPGQWQGEWDANFGYLADKGRLVVIDEWSAYTMYFDDTYKGWCLSDRCLDEPGQLLRYMKSKNLGLVGWSFDTPGTLVKLSYDQSGNPVLKGEPTTFTGKACGLPNGGPGELIQRYFAGLPTDAVACYTSGIADGQDMTLALASDGGVCASGDGLDGDTGGGPASTFTAISGLTNILGVYAGTEHGLALASDGTLQAWGANDHGQLGNGLPSSQPEPTPVSVIGLSQVKVRDAAAGLAHSIALVELTTDAGKPVNEVYAWGSNAHGQVGNGSTSDAPSPVLVLNPSASDAGSQSGIVAVAAGSNHSLALGGDGTVWAWGENDHGELGNGDMSRADRSTPETVYAPSSNSPPAIAISAGYAYSVMLRADGTVWTSGSFCNGTTGSQKTTFAQVSFPQPQDGGLTGITITAVSAGNVTLYALDSGGTVWACGANTSPAPVQSGPAGSSFSGVVSLGQGGMSKARHAWQGTPDGGATLYGWGDNSHQQIGDGTSNNQTYPEPVCSPPSCSLR